MHNNFHFLKYLAASLNNKFKNATIEAIFTQEKNELIIACYNTKCEPIFIKAFLQSHLTIILSPKQINRKHKNSVDLFKNLIDLQIDAIVVNNWDRSISIFFINKPNLTLQIQLYGNKGNIHLYNEETIIEQFKNAQVTAQLVAPLNHKNIDYNLSKEQFCIDQGALSKVLPTAGKLVKIFLENQGYEAKPIEKKYDIIRSFTRMNKNQTFYLCENQMKFVLSIFPVGKVIQIYNNSINAVNDFFYTFQKNHLLGKLKTDALNILYKQRKKSHQYIIKSKLKLEELKTGRPPCEIADIIMASLHQIDIHDKTVSLFDFYKNDQIEIKMKKGISPQKFAERLYRKSKNQQKEIDNLHGNINSKSNQLKIYNKHIDFIEKSTEFRLLKKYIKEHQLDKIIVNTDRSNKPFFEVIFLDYKIHIGKNAKNNDMMLRSFSHKNDLWLHVKEATGSHVLIKNASGQTVPLVVREEAASLAAGYSKIGKELVCPVICTERKYVRKLKGGAPGQVVVDKETVLLVKPKRLHS